VELFWTDQKPNNLKKRFCSWKINYQLFAVTEYISSLYKIFKNNIVSNKLEHHVFD
jgi:hypothetical protein